MARRFQAIPPGGFLHHRLVDFQPGSHDVGVVEVAVEVSQRRVQANANKSSKFPQSSPRYALWAEAGRRLAWPAVPECCPLSSRAAAAPRRAAERGWARPLEGVPTARRPETTSRKERE